MLVTLWGQRANSKKFDWYWICLFRLKIYLGVSLWVRILWQLSLSLVCRHEECELDLHYKNHSVSNAWRLLFFCCFLWMPEQQIQPRLWGMKGGGVGGDEAQLVFLTVAGNWARSECKMGASNFSDLRPQGSYAIMSSSFSFYLLTKRSFSVLSWLFHITSK